MNSRALLCLQFLRDCQKKNSDFNRGYALGYVNAEKYDFEPWVRQYIENVLNQIIWLKASA
jgi:hypothetical protein